MKDSFIIYTKYEEQISLLSDAQAGVLFRALFCYQTEKTLPQMDGITNIVFTTIRQDIAAENQRYNEICEINKANGKRGGRPSKSLINKGNKPKKPNGFESDEKKPSGFLGYSEKPNGFNKENSPNEKESSKEKEITLIRNQESKKERNLYINNNQGACACESQETYENIINHYAGDIDEETRAAIWNYIQYFQAKTGCFILNEQLKTFLKNLRNNSLLFEGGVLGCMNSDGINLALMEVGENWGLGRMGQFLRIERDEEYDET